MAKFKARKVNVVKTNRLLCALVAFVVLCITIVSIFSDSLIAIRPNRVRPSQNIKVIDGADNRAPMLKEGQELFIKESNGQIKKISEVITMEDGIKIPKSILDEMGKVSNIKVEQVGNNLKALIDFKEINDEYKGCFNHTAHGNTCRYEDFGILPTNPFAQAVPNQDCQPKALPHQLMQEINKIATAQASHHQGIPVQRVFNGNPFNQLANV